MASTTSSAAKAAGSAASAEGTLRGGSSRSRGIGSSRAAARSAIVGRMRLWLLIAGCLAATFLVPAGARGQSSSDPEATSPSGTIYQIPLDTARRQAAPRRSPAGGGGGEGSSSQGGSNYRSENGFGSSSQVPGAPAEAQGSGDAGGSGKESASGQGSSSNASGDDRSRELANSSSVPNATADHSDSSGPSDGGVVLMLALLLGVAIATVILATRARRRSS